MSKVTTYPKFVKLQNLILDAVSVEIGATEMKVLRKESLNTKLYLYLTTKWFVQMFFGTLQITVSKILYQNETLVSLKTLISIRRI